MERWKYMELFEQISGRGPAASEDVSNKEAVRVSVVAGLVERDTDGNLCLSGRGKKLAELWGRVREIPPEDESKATSCFKQFWMRSLLPGGLVVGEKDEEGLQRRAPVGAG